MKSEQRKSSYYYAYARYHSLVDRVAVVQQPIVILTYALNVPRLLWLRPIQQRYSVWHYCFILLVLYKHREENGNVLVWLGGTMTYATELHGEHNIR